MVIPFQAAHLKSLSPTAAGLEMLALPGVIGALERLAPLDFCKTIFTRDGSSALGIMGAVPITEDLCEVLIVSSEERGEHSVTFLRGVRDGLVKLRQHFGNIQAVGEDTSFSRRWLSWLGFACEGPIMRPEFGEKKMLLWRLKVHGS